METASQLHLRREGLKATLNSYQSQYIDTCTGLLSESISLLRSCPVCQDVSKEKYLFTKNGSRHIYCTNCRFIFTKNALDPEHLRSYYANLPHLQGVFAENESVFYTTIYRKGLLSILENLVKDDLYLPSLLDIGCSTGFFLDVAKDHKLDCAEGVEINIEDRSYAQSKGHTVYESLQHVKRLYNVITLWDVFEHIENPFEFISQVKKCLLPYGLLFIQIPTCDSLAARILRSDCNMFDGIEHLNLYSSYALGKIAAKANLEIVSLESVIDELFPISHYLAYDNPYTPKEHCSLELGKIMSPEQILSSGFGYKLQVVFRCKQ